MKNSPALRKNTGRRCSFAGHKGKIVAAIYGAAKMQCIFLTLLVYLGSFKGHRCAYGHDAPGIRLYRRGYAAIAGAQGITELMYKSIFAVVFPGTFLTASMCIPWNKFLLLLITSAILTVIVYILEWKCSRKKPAETAEYN